MNAFLNLFTGSKAEKKMEFPKEEKVDSKISVGNLSLQLSQIKLEERIERLKEIEDTKKELDRKELNQKELEQKDLDNQELYKKDLDNQELYKKDVDKKQIKGSAVEQRVKALEQKIVGEKENVTVAKVLPKALPIVIAKALPIVIAGFVQERMNGMNPKPEDQARLFCIVGLDEIIANIDAEYNSDRILEELEQIDSLGMCFVAYICASFMYYTQDYYPLTHFGFYNDARNLAALFEFLKKYHSGSGPLRVHFMAPKEYALIHNVVYTFKN